MHGCALGQSSESYRMRFSKPPVGGYGRHAESFIERNISVSMTSEFLGSCFFPLLCVSCSCASIIRPPHSIDRASTRSRSCVHGPSVRLRACVGGYESRRFGQPHSARPVRAPVPDVRKCSDDRPSAFMPLPDRPSWCARLNAHSHSRTRPNTTQGASISLPTGLACHDESVVGGCQTYRLPD